VPELFTDEDLLAGLSVVLVPALLTLPEFCSDEDLTADL